MQTLWPRAVKAPRLGHPTRDFSSSTPATSHSSPPSHSQLLLLTTHHDQYHHALLLLLLLGSSWGPALVLSSPLIRRIFLIGSASTVPPQAVLSRAALQPSPDLTPIAGISVSSFVPPPDPLGCLPTALALPLCNHSDA